MVSVDRSLELERAIAELKPGDHLCCLYENEDEHRALLTPYLRQGLERGEKVIYIVDARTAQVVLEYLRDGGVDVTPFMESGQLGILSADESYMREGVFDPDGMISLLKVETEQALAEGYPALRATGEMSWALRGLPGADRLIEYEAKLNRFIPDHRFLAICQYDRRRFPSDVLLDVLATHPVAVVGTELYDNFYYIPPDEFLCDDRAGAALSRQLENLAVRKSAERERERLLLHLSEINQQLSLANFQAKERQAEAEAAQEKVTRILESVTDGFVAVDRQWQFTYVNAQAERLLGTTRQALTGKVLWELFPGAVGSTTYDSFQRVLSQQVPVELEVFSQRNNGWLSLHAYPSEGGLAVFVRDITVRKRAEDSLRESEEKYRNLYETMAPGVVYQDSTGRIISANPAAQRILGLSLDELQGRSSADPRWKAIHEDGSEFPGETHPSSVALRTGREVRNVVMGVFHPRQTSRRWINITAVPHFRSGEDFPYEVYTTFEDITERKQAEEELRRARDELDHSRS